MGDASTFATSVANVRFSPNIYTLECIQKTGLTFQPHHRQKYNYVPYRSLIHVKKSNVEMGNVSIPDFKNVMDVYDFVCKNGSQSAVCKAYLEEYKDYVDLKMMYGASMTPISIPTEAVTFVYVEKAAKPITIVSIPDQMRLAMALYGAHKKKRCKSVLFHNNVVPKPEFLIRECLHFEMIECSEETMIVIPPNVCYFVICPSETVTVETKRVSPIYPSVSRPINLCKCKHETVAGCPVCGYCGPNVERHTSIHTTCWCCKTTFANVTSLLEHYNPQKAKEVISKAITLSKVANKRKPKPKKTQQEWTIQTEGV